MATIDVGGGPSGRKAVDTEIPLIPFIDLLLCCVMFLLVTAVWNELAGHHASQRVPGIDTADQPPPERVRLVLRVRHDGYVLASTAGDQVSIPKVAGTYDATGLAEGLASYRQADPARREITVVPDDGVQFRAVVGARTT
ncbi:MAG: biopolymer transporter ExbD [Myxococcales bacterium]|nr:biopolymer transporter ExbD [Myxococcales bacterium]